MYILEMQYRICIFVMRLSLMSNQSCHILISIRNISDSIYNTHIIIWVQSCRYLGITVESASHCKCNIGEAKKIVLPIL